MIDLIIVLAFVGYVAYSGISARKAASKNLQEYFLAGNTITGWRAGFSMAATQFAADTPLLVMGLIAVGGIFKIWQLWVYGIAFLLLGYVFAAGWRRAKVLTDAELTEIRYSGKGVLLLRVLKAFYYGTVFNCVVMAMVLVAAVRITEVFLPWHQWLPEIAYNIFLNFTQWSGLSNTLGNSAIGLAPEISATNNLLSILTIVAFTATYSTTGGLRGIIKADVAQFALAMIATSVYAVVVVNEVGGLSAMTTKVFDLYGQTKATEMLSFAPTSTGDLLIPFLMIISLQWFFQMNSDGTGYLAQRTMSCTTDRDARIAAAVFAWMQIFLRSIIWLVIGVGLLVIYPFSADVVTNDQFTASREMVFVTGINDLLPVGIKGLMLTGLLAALASTIDSHMNWGASYWSNDIYKRLVCQAWLKRDPDRRELVWAARLSTLLILLIAFIVMTQLGSIQEGWTTSLLIGAGMGSVLVLRWLWERINLYSEIAAIIVSLITFFVLAELFPNSEDYWIKLSLMALISTIATIGITFITPKTDETLLVNFYNRVKPMGFWQTTAKLAGHQPQHPTEKLWQGLKLTALTVLSLFLMLIGVGKSLIHIPGESWLLPISCIIISLALIPLWWKGLNKQGELLEEE